MVNDPIITLNGTQLSSPDSRLPAYPGRKNKLTLEVEASGNNHRFVVLKISAPDGRQRSVVQQIEHGGLVKFDLGPLAVPAVYEYEAGVVYRRGYRLEVSIFDRSPETHATPLVRYGLYQGCTQDRDAEWFFPGSKERVAYTDGWIPEGSSWNPFDYSARPMDPPIDLRLGLGVLIDQNDVRIRYRLRHDSPELKPIDGILTGRYKAGERCFDPIDITVKGEWQELTMEVSGWATGEYVFEILPRIDRKLYEEGPTLAYRREAADPTRLRVSPLAPYTVTIDEGHPRWDVDSWNTVDFSPYVTPDIAGGLQGRSILRCEKFSAKRKLKLPFELIGPYALFMEAVGPLYVNCGDGLIRPVTSNSDIGDPSELGPVFVCARDMTDSVIEVFGAQEDSTLGRIRFVPITADSLEEFQNTVRNPVVPLRGIADWWVYFLDSPFLMSYMEEDQFDTILAGQREVGISSEAWAIGRSWVTYESNLPRASKFPCNPITEEVLQELPNMGACERMVQEFDALGYPLKRRSHHDTRIYTWFGMNRHYGPNVRGGTHTSPWVSSHPELNLRKKDGTPDQSRVEFHFEESRSERLDIFVESSGFLPDGIVVGWCRQPPHAGYHPEIVEAYRKETGEDPRNLDLSDGQKFNDWLKWRCEHGTTRLMRDLRKEISKLQRESGHRLPIAARVPSEGFYFNMAMGMDIETWIKEGLIDELQLNPLENRGGECSVVGSHDVRPYIDLCRIYGVLVFGGISGTSATRISIHNTTGKERPGPDYSPAAGLRRAIGLIRAGVDGIEIYESDMYSHLSHHRWLVPLFGSQVAAQVFLDGSNLESVFPITASNAARGHDVHWTTGHSLFGTKTLPRGAKELV